MKKGLLTLVIAAMAATASAQPTAVTSNRFSDNWYVGLNAGMAATPTAKGNAFHFEGLAPNAGLRLGKNLTTVFGLAVEGTAYCHPNGKSGLNRKNFVDLTTVNLLGTFNLSNLFCGYNGEPRTFELIGLYGLGWTHTFGTTAKANGIDSKVALDLTLNLGREKAVQLYVEPAMIYGLQSYGNGWGRDFKYNLADAFFQVNGGLVYKFSTSNGTHNFARQELREQSEVDALNAKINELRANNANKDSRIAQDARAIADLQAQLAACQSRPTQTIVQKKEENVLQPLVIFQQGKSTVEPVQYASIEMIAKYMRNHRDAKILIRGYASPEGSLELNQKLSLARAEAVKAALVNRYKIPASRLVTEGMGATDKLSSETDFNRVVMFIDTTVR